MDIDIPLITPLSMKYYNKASCKENEAYYRALDIRLCLEKICDEIILEFVSSEAKKNWSKYTLHKKLEAAKSFLDSTVIDNLITAKGIGNTGVHEGEEGYIEDSDIAKSMKFIRDFSLDIFVSYFKKNGFESRMIPWIPTVFSTLPPSYRVEILEKYYAIKPSEFVIDKLSMAYLKNCKEKEARDFLKKCLKKQEISEMLYFQLDEKLSILKESFDLNIERFSIARSLDEAKENFNRLLPSINEEDRGTFVILVSMILNGSNPK